MIQNGILDEIGFTADLNRQYEKYKALAGDEPDILADSFMKDEKNIKTAIEEMDASVMGGVPKFAKYLLFFLSCTGPLYEKYKDNGYSDELYIDTMKDISCKVNENLDLYDDIGISCPNWFSDYFKLTRFGFGRMQFDITHHPCEAVEIAGHIVNEGDFIIRGHVPSTGPLIYEECVKSYKRAYEFVKGQFSGDLLPVEYWSWMLFPHYKDFFGEGSNSKRFIADYKVFGHFETDVFHDAWRIFGKDAGKEKENLPAKTSLQRKFIEYIGPGKTYGYGKGIFLFDGENILK